MRKKMFMAFMKMMIPQLLKLLTPDVIKSACDAALDVIETAAARSDTIIDDMTVLPVCKMIRAALDIPDNDDAVAPSGYA